MKFLTGKKNNTISKFYLFSFLRDLSLVTAVLIPFYTDWGHISLTQALILQSWFGFWIFILEIPTGAIADRFGRKFSLVLGSLIVAAATLVYGSVPDFRIFLLGEFLYALAFALTSGADSALLYDYLKEKGREKESTGILGRVHSLRLLGILTAALIGGPVAFRFGLNAPMLLSSIPFLLSGIVAWSIKESKIYDNTQESKRYLNIAVNGFTFFYKHKVLRIMAIDAVLVMSGAYFIIWLYQILLKQINIPIVYFGLFSALLISSEILISSNFERLEKLFGSGKNLLKFGAFITGISFILVAIKINIFTVLFFIILGGGFGMTRLTLMTAYMNKHIPSDKRATVLSSVSMLRRFLLIFLGPVIGYLADSSLTIALLAVSILPLSVIFFSKIEQEMLE